MNAAGFFHGGVGLRHFAIADGAPPRALGERRSASPLLGTPLRASIDT